MGKILNTTYSQTIDNLTQFNNDLIKNPFYLFNNLKPTKCKNYYNINKDYSSLDPGSKLAYDNIGPDSPIRYNRIEDLYIYGFNKIELNTDLDEFGLEADKIEGDCFILPNSFIPTEGDYFEVDHIKDRPWLFIVKDVQIDTLDNGANVYKLTYKLEYNNDINIKDRVIYNFKSIETKEGTNISSIVRCEDYEIAKIMDEKAVMLKKYFNDLFYNKKVQTFIFEDEYSESYLYDPFLIEFLIRNKILENSSEGYIHVCHQIEPNPTFTIDYDCTFFRKFEKKEKDKLIMSNRYAQLELIKAFGSIFDTRYEDYYKLNYIDGSGTIGLGCICSLKDDIIYQIIEHNLESIKDEDINSMKPELWKNIIIKYFYNESIIEEELNSIDRLKFDSSIIAFYTIPLLIFCLEQFILNALK